MLGQSPVYTDASADLEVEPGCDDELPKMEPAMRVQDEVVEDASAGTESPPGATPSLRRSTRVRTQTDFLLRGITK